MTVHEGQELTETALLSFLRDGYLVLQPPELDAAFHAEAFEAAAALYRTARSERGPVHLTLLGDHLLAHVPSLYNMLNAPSVRAALTGILGPDYALHPHHFVHAAGAADQGFHQDGNLPWNTRGHFRSPRPVAAILFYYPQAVSDDMGPTEILPGTQYWRGAFESEDSWHADDALDRGFEAEVARHPDLAYRDARLDQSLAVLGRSAVTRERLRVPAGSVVILHYDLVHRGTRQGPGTPAARYMYKFSFLRTREPGPSLRWPSLQWPSQRHRIAGAEPTADATDPAAYPAAWALRWLRGEPERYIPSAAQVDIWLNGLRSPEEPVRRAAGFALGAAGHTPSSGDHPISDHALQGLAQATTDSDVRVRRMAAFALGETRRIEPAAVAALTSALGDPDDLVRSNAATALGSLLRVGALPVSVTDALLERLDPALEPDNTQSAGMSRSTVRECVAEALLMAARNGRLTDLQRPLLAMRGRNDPGRYVRGLIEQALLRDGYAENTQTQRDDAAQ